MTITVNKSAYGTNEEAEVTAAIVRWMHATSIIVAPYISEFTVISATFLDSQIPWHEVERSGQMQLIQPVSVILRVGSEEAMLQTGIAFDVGSPEAIRWAEEYVGKRVTVITNETRTAIKELTAKGIREGQNPIKWSRELRKSIGLNVRQAKAYEKLRDELTNKGLPQFQIDKKLATEYKKKIKYRGEMIARTESAAAYCEGEIETYKDAGITKVEFNPSAGACEICEPLRGREYTLNDARGVIPVHPNCRCDWLSVEESYRGE